ncbi:hypothetical protein OG800_49590 (plasmid) [Streptomyces sp. NBC_00445]|uniref:DUF7715 family protein n=1 Tax=Streptomyces sp. NBC_00445 TaxID=2975745 RepID=UPI002E24C1E4
MKLIITAADSNYFLSRTDFSWTRAGEILTVGTDDPFGPDDSFVGLDFGRFTKRGRVADGAVDRTQVLRKIIGHLTRNGLYELHGQRPSVKTRKRITEFLDLAEGFDVGTVLDHNGRLCPFTGSAPTTAP